MRRAPRFPHALVAGLALVLAAACVPGRPPGPAPPPPAPAPAPPEWMIVVSKSARTLSVLHRGRPVRTYPIVLGLNPKGPKRYQGDMRTPEGLYHVTSKRPHPRWRYFIALDYPNERDRQRYERALRERLVPVLDGRPLPIGGGIGIHGTDRPREQRNGVDWTHGCIAVDNDAMEELYRLVKPGMPVRIDP